MTNFLLRHISSWYQPQPTTVFLVNGLLEYQALHFIQLSTYVLGEPKSIIIVTEIQISKASLVALDRLFPTTNYQFIELKNHWSNHILFKLVRLVLITPFALLLSFLTNRSSLIQSSYPWLLSQIMHGVWDLSQRYAPNNIVTPSLKDKYLAALSNLTQLSKSAHYTLAFRPALIFLGHSVYAGRSSMAFYRMLPIPIYAHSFHALNKVAPHSDSSVFTPTKLESKAFLKIVRQLDPTTFWEDRKAGHSNYYDARNSFIGIKTTDTTPANIIYLHIYRDSPFNHIDRTRIFADYFHWTLETLRVLKNSNETWLIKTHPTSTRWGEDSLAITYRLLSTVFPTGLPEHILIDESTLSNSSLLSHARRIITFSGSVHLEAAAHSIKPIVISSTLLEAIDPSLVFKPSTMATYTSLLLTPSRSPDFHLSYDQTLLSRQILQLKENYLTYGDDFNIMPLYPSDSLDYQSQVLESFIRSSLDASQFTRRLAYYLANGLTRSTSSRILDSFYHLMNQSSS